MILPGATLGILGGGQLARMMALEARPMGYRVWVLDANPRCPAAQVSDGCVVGGWDDPAAAMELARRCDVVTLDTEHIPASILDRVAKEVELRPGAEVLRVIQDRQTQRAFLARHDLPQPPLAPVSSLEQLQDAVETLGTPCVLKTARDGYDGKGQVRIDDASRIGEAWEAVGAQPCVLEAFVELAKEISVVLARDVDGRVVFYPVAENIHLNHVLHTTIAPARVEAHLARRACELGETIARLLDYVGVMAVEFFVTGGGELLVNEIAPRTHNSGHYTFGACLTSQFDQHVRAILGLPLGDPSLVRPVVMVNLLGDLWQGERAPDWTPLLADPRVRLHLYGKEHALPGRKMGHVLFFGDDPLEVASKVDALQRVPRP